MPFSRQYRRALILSLLIPGCLRVAAADSAPPPRPAPETLRLFDYDARAPLGFQTVSTRRQGKLTIREITYASPRGGRVSATLAVPDGRGPFAGILLLHGMPGSRADMRPEAEALARQGAVTLAIDAPFARADYRGEPIRLTLQDRDQEVQLIVDLRRGADLLAARPDVDAKRLAYVGHSYGGIMGGILAGVEKRFRACALEVGDGSVIAHITANPDFQQLPRATRERWLAAMEPIEPIRFVGRAAPASLLFQSGRRDTIVQPASAAAYQAAGSQPKTVKWYDAGHFLNEQAVRDRRLWLAAQVGLAKPE